ncbi:hypothetical protein EV715DRAFT_199504 [Schizophyllum commune]
MRDSLMQHELEASTIDPFLTAILPMILKFLSREYELPTYTSSVETPYSQFIADLGLPAPGGIPELLLHRLGLDPIVQHRAESILLIKPPKRQRNKWLVNTTGSGKTRLAMEVLTLHLGFYLTAAQDGSGLGSTDLCVLVDSMLADVVTNVTTNIEGPRQQSVFDDNAKIVAKCFVALLLARAYILKRFLKLASESGGLTQRHKHAWLLFQLLPVFDVALDKDPSDDQARIMNSDVFAKLMRYIIDKNLPLQELNFILQDILEDIFSYVNRNFRDGKVVFVLDESQVLVKKHTASFKSATDANQTRPLLREIVANLVACTDSWPTKAAILGLGTGISAQSIEEAIHSVSGKNATHEVHTEIGAFDTVAAQQTYMRLYIPNAILGSSSGRLLAARCWQWLRGRHRFLAKFLVELIRAGFRAPHTVLNAYVKKLTNCILQDADRYIEEEEAEVSGIDMPNVYPVLRPKTWPPTLIITIAQAVTCYLMRGVVSIVCGEDEHDMIYLGVARYRRSNNSDPDKDSEACIDEPLIMLAGTLHFDVSLKDPDTITSTYQVLGSRIPEHCAPFNRNGWEEFLPFIFWYFVFCEPRRLGDVFNIIGRPDLADEKVVMALVRKDTNGDVVVHSSAEAGPRPAAIRVVSNGEKKIEYTKELYYHTPFSTMGVVDSIPTYDGLSSGPFPKQWIRHEAHAPACFLPTCYGPDSWFHLQIVEGKNRGNLITASVQYKYRRYGLNDDGARRAIQSVTPAHLGDAKLKRARLPESLDLTQAELDSLKTDLKNAFNSIEGGTPPDDMFGECHVLRVVASTIDLNLERLDKATATPKFQEELDDSHPLATLNTEYVDSILKKPRPQYKLTNGKAHARVDGKDEEDKEEDEEPAVPSTSCAADDQPPFSDGDDARVEVIQSEEQTEGSTAMPASDVGNGQAPEEGVEDPRANDEVMEDVSAIPSTSGAGDNRVTTTMTTRGSSKRSNQGGAAERAPKRPRNAQASPPKGHRIVTRSVTRMQKAETSIGTRRSTRLATKANATAGPSTSQASGTGPAR